MLCEKVCRILVEMKHYHGTCEPSRRSVAFRRDIYPVCWFLLWISGVFHRWICKFLLRKARFLFFVDRGLDCCKLRGKSVIFCFDFGIFELLFQKVIKVWHNELSFLYGKLSHNAFQDDLSVCIIPIRHCHRNVSILSILACDSSPIFSALPKIRALKRIGNMRFAVRGCTPIIKIIIEIFRIFKDRISELSFGLIFCLPVFHQVNFIQGQSDWSVMCEANTHFAMRWK